MHQIKRIFLYTILCWTTAMNFYCQEMFTNSFVVEDLSINHIFSDTQGAVYIVGMEKRNSQPTYSDSVWRLLKCQPNGKRDWDLKIHSKKSIKLTSTFYNNKLLLAGHFSDTLFAPTGNLVSNGQRDLCYMEIDQSGHIALYQEGSTGNEEINCILALNTGELYLTGNVRGNYSVCNLTGNTDTILTTVLQKRSSIYSPIWADIGTTLSDLGEIKADANNLYVFAMGDIKWKNMSSVVSCFNYVKLDLNGNFLQNIDGANYQLEANKLNFVDSQTNLFFVQHFGYKTDKTYIKSQAQNNLLNWRYECDANPWDSKALLEQGDNILWYSFDYLNGIEKNLGTLTHRVKLNLRTYSAWGCFDHYTGNELLFYGNFSDSISLGNTTYRTKMHPAHSNFIAVLDRSLLTSTHGVERETLTTNTYPNPTDGILFVKTEQPVKLLIVNSLGQTVLTKDLTNNENKLDLSALMDGVYLIESAIAGKRTIQKIVLRK